MGKYKLLILKFDLGSTSEDSSSSTTESVDESVFSESQFSLVQHEVHWGAQTSVWLPSQINVQGCCKSISTMAILAYAYWELWFLHSYHINSLQIHVLECHKQSFNFFIIDITPFSEWRDVIRFIHEHFIDIVVSPCTCRFYITRPNS